MQLGAHCLPGDIVIGIGECLSRSPLDLRRPGRFDVGLWLAIEAGEQIRRQLRAFGDRKLHRILQ